MCTLIKSTMIIPIHLSHKLFTFVQGDVISNVFLSAIKDNLRNYGIMAKKGIDTSQYIVKWNSYYKNEPKINVLKLEVG